MSDTSSFGGAILITGAQGFIGSWLTRRLLSDGEQVVVLRRSASADSPFCTDGLERHCEFAETDLTDLDALGRVLRDHRVGAVFHLAAQPLVGLALESPHGTFEANIRGTYTLLEACRLAQSERGRLRSVVVASSANVYGPDISGSVNERHALEPRNPHDVSKAAGDMIARSYAKTYGLPVGVLRLTNVFGGGDINWSRIVPATARSLACRQRPLIRSDGTVMHDFVYVADAVEAYLTVSRSLAEAGLHGRSWNAGSARPRSVMDVVNGLIAASGTGIEPEIRGGAPRTGPPSPGQAHINCDAISRELGWQPQWAFEDALAETYAWYECHLPGLPNLGPPVTQDQTGV